jgi:AraC-like DNA-binding protein
LSEPIYKTIDLNDTHRDWIQSLVMNGYTFKEIAEALGLSETGFKKSLAHKVEIQHILKQGSEKAISDVTMSLQKLAKGFVRTEREYNVDLDRVKLTHAVNPMIDALKGRDLDKFLEIFMGCSNTSPENAVGKIKVREIEVAPDKNAAIKILEALKEDVWDLEGKRKKIPDKKIIVSLNGEDAQRLLKRSKELKADFVVSN